MAKFNGDLDWFMGTVYFLTVFVIGMFVFCLITPRKGGPFTK